VEEIFGEDRLVLYIRPDYYRSKN